jgi:hypothetical protein
MALCTTYGILARDGRSVAIFRRGPTRWTLLLRWWLRSDRIEEGQWLGGHVYPERSDLSPDGTYLLYFAGDWRRSRGFGTYTVVSRMPFFTALALWPVGDTWCGGGLFASPRRVALDHRSSKMTLAPGFSVPKGWRVEQIPLPRPQASLDAYIGNAVERARLLRDGWVVADGTAQRDTHGSLIAIEPPLTFSRPQPGGTIILSWLTHGLRRTNGPSRQHSVRLVTSSGRLLRQIDDADWADFAPTGDLLLGHGGCLYRLPETRVPALAAEPLEDARLIADLRPLSFRRRPPSREAMRW